MLKKYYYFFLLLTILTLPTTSVAQKIENLHFEQVGKQIIIYYNLIGTQPDQTYEVQIYCSTDGGKTFGSPLKMVTGNVGSNQTGGSGKKIIWDVLSEKEDLIGDVIFELVFSSASKFDMLTDPRDGQMYKVIKIGTQTWMAENLNFDAGAGSYINNDTFSSGSTYGRYYNWETAIKVCPSGWHLPDDVEWATLCNYLGGWQEAGGKMKETGYIHWREPNTGATNESSFSALPGGFRNEDGFFNSVNTYAFFWTSSKDIYNKVKTRYLYYIDVTVHFSRDIKDWGFSVRCVKD